MNIYDKKEFDKKKYHWNQESLKRIKKFLVVEIILSILYISIVVWMIWAIMYIKTFAYRTYLIILLSTVILSKGLKYALSLQKVKTSKKLKKEEQHDFSLYEYHRSKIMPNIRLLNMAWINIQLDRYDLAQMALEKINIKECKGKSLQQI